MCDLPKKNCNDWQNINAKNTKKKCKQQLLTLQITTTEKKVEKIRTTINHKNNTKKQSTQTSPHKTNKITQLLPFSMDSNCQQKTQTQTKKLQHLLSQTKKNGLKQRKNIETVKKHNTANTSTIQAHQKHPIQTGKKSKEKQSKQAQTN